MPLLGMLASSPCVLTKDVRIWICDHCTDTEFNMYFPLLPSTSAPLALLLLTFSRPYSKLTIQLIH